METEKYSTLHPHVVKDKDGSDREGWRRRCGCLKTSDKLKELLKAFPSAPPPSPVHNDDGLKCLAEPSVNPKLKISETCQCDLDCSDRFKTQTAIKYDVNCITVSKCIYPTSFAVNSHCISAYCKRRHGDRYISRLTDVKDDAVEEEFVTKKPVRSRSWLIVSELVQLLQLTVTATALALYYLIYCYMQLVYYTLRSALYFHNADGPMKVTIGVVTVTSVIVGFNLLLRMERLIGVF